VSKSLEKNYITPGGHKRLVDELEWLKKVERPEVTKVVSWAASLGDRSENADYIYGKKRLREIDSRTRFLLSRLDKAIVVDPTQTKSDRVQFGASVVVCDEEGNERHFSIVGVDETDGKQGRISWKSPIGSKLLGKSAGDSIEVTTPNGVDEYEIVSIEYKRLEVEEFKK
jgi:transcription elongation factor GreB